MGMDDRQGSLARKRIELVLCDQSAGLLDQVPQHRERFGYQRDTDRPPPEALIRFVQPERRKRFHRGGNYPLLLTDFGHKFPSPALSRNLHATFTPCA
jgi:hypothetical protein